MDASEPSASFEEYVDSHIGFKAESLSAIAATFGLKGHNAEMLYYQLVLVALGLASACTCGRSPLSIPQVSEILGKNVRAFLMVIRAGVDEREKYVPDAGAGPGGESAPSPAISRMMSGENWNACSAIPSTLHPNLSAKRIPA
ncbi:MAG: hypothetical protein IJ636_00075 [Bacteroidales bacterium]|nr:hypothetical protein [Bacteroidales bacterium]